MSQAPVSDGSALPLVCVGEEVISVLKRDRGARSASPSSRGSAENAAATAISGFCGATGSIAPAVVRKAPRNQAEFREFTKQQYDSKAFGFHSKEREWTVLKMSHDVGTFYDGIALHNKSEVPSLSKVRQTWKAPHQYLYNSFGPRVRGILVVEDSSTQMKLICRTLSVMGTMLNEKWVFFEATSGELALSIYEGLRIDLVFVDQNLAAEGVRGDELIKEIRKVQRNKKLLTIGVISNPKGVDTVSSAGADLVFVKPFSVHDTAVRSISGLLLTC